MDDNQQQNLNGQEPGQQQNADTLAGQQQAGSQAQSQQQQQQNVNPTEPQQGQNPAAGEGTVIYDFSGVQMPEGYSLSEEESKQFVDVIKGMGLSNEQAGTIVKFGTEYGKRLVDAVVKQHEDMVNEWGETAKAELGSNFDKTLSLAAVARDKFPGLKEALDESGAGNRIEVIRAMAKLGEYLSGDPGMAQGAGTLKGGGADPMSDAKTLYPNTDFSRYR